MNSARDRLRAYFEKNVGKVVTKDQLRKVAGISEWARRVRELRDEEGMQISSHKDRHDLKPGQYVLESLKRNPKVGRGISLQLRNEILERNGYTCQLCGATGGDPHPTEVGKKVRLEIDHIKPVSQGGTDEKDNLRVLCSACNQMKSNVEAPSEKATNVLARIRKLSKKDQLSVYNALRRSVEGISE